jgi:peptidoglycan/LPS O-acetylase OafA/YrhL
MSIPVQNRIPALDGVRGVAILMVMLVHYRTILTGTGLERTVYSIFEPGWSGVDLFFVLSGFLITGILLDTRAGPFCLREFWWRRALRILPVYYFCLALLFIGMNAFYHYFLHKQPWHGLNVWWYLGYLSNWKANHGDGDPHLGHMWSLAIEEQFYLVWPLAVYWLSRRRLVWLCVSLVGLALGLRIWFTYLHASPVMMYRLTPMRMDALAIGALLAVAVRNARVRAWMAGHVKAVLCAALGVLTAIAALNGTFDFDKPWVHTVGVSVLEVFYACLVFLAFAGTAGLGPRVFAWRPLRSIGKYSYAMYLFHFTPHLILESRVQQWLLRHPQRLATLVHFFYLPVMIGLSYGLARLSWLLLESRLEWMKSHNPLIARHASPQVASGGITA